MQKCVIKILSNVVLLVIVIFTSACEQSVTESEVPVPMGARTVFIESIPSGAAIFLNGHNMGQKTPDSIVWIESDSNSIKLRLPLYRDSIFSRFLPERSTTKIMVDFTQNPKMRGGIFCSTSPDTAQIFLNDSATGLTTPAYITGLLPGNYQIKFVKKGCWDASLQAVVQSDQFTSTYKELEDTSKWLTYLPEYSGIPEKFFNTLYIDAADIKWLGGSSTGLTRFDDHNWKSYNTSNSGIPSDHIYTIVEDAMSNLWIGTNDGLAKFDRNTFTVFNSQNSSLPSNSITAVRIAGGDTIWVGTTRGLALFANNQWKTFPTSPVATQWINAIGISRTGILFCCTKSGLYFFDGTTWGEVSDVVSSNVYSFTLLSNGKAYVGAIGNGSGLFYSKAALDVPPTAVGSGGSCAVLCTVPTISGTGVFDIYIVPGNEVWVSTERGVYRFTDPRYVYNYNSAQKLLKSDNVRTIRRDSKQVYWIATSGGGLTKYKGNIIP